MATILQLLNSLEEIITFFKDCPSDIIERTKQIRTEAIEKFETNPTLEVVSELIELLKEQMELCKTELARPIVDLGLEPIIPIDSNKIADSKNILNDKYKIGLKEIIILINSFDKLNKFLNSPFISKKLSDENLLSLLHFLKYPDSYKDDDLWNNTTIKDLISKIDNFPNFTTIDIFIYNFGDLIENNLFGVGLDEYNFYFSYEYNNSQLKKFATPNGFSIRNNSYELSRRLKYYLKYLIYKQKYLNLKNQLIN